MNKLKIAYYTEINLNDNDGPAVNESEFIVSLASVGAGNYKIFLTKQNREVPFLQDKDVVYLDSSPRVSQLFAWISRALFINRVIKQYKIDLLVCRIGDFPLVVLFLKIFNPKLKIAIKTAALWWASKRSNVKISLKDRIYNFLNDYITRTVYKNADMVDVAMPETKGELIRQGLIRDDNVILIDNAINTNVFQPKPIGPARSSLKIPEDSIVLGFAGSLPSHRGVKHILKVAETLKETYENLYVLIVGDDSELNSVINLSTFPRNRIISVGKVPYAEVDNYIAAMTICYSFFEGWKLQKTGNASQKVKQYISMGKPVISVDVGHGYLKDHDLGSPVNQENIEEIINATKMWIEKSNKDESMAMRLHKYAREHLSTEKTFQQRLVFWNSVIKG